MSRSDFLMHPKRPPPSCTRSFPVIGLGFPASGPHNTFVRQGRHNRLKRTTQLSPSSAGCSRRASFLSALQISRMPELLYLIDVSSLVFQVFHAIPEMTSPHGLPTNAVFGFTRDILNILTQKKPTHLICATDPSGPGERESLYPRYKAQRSAMPEELRPQFPFIARTI